MEWIPIEAEVIKESDNAICLRFANGVTGWHDKDIWIPKSAYSEYSDGAFNRQRVKKWVYYSKNIYRYQ